MTNSDPQLAMTTPTPAADAEELNAVIDAHDWIETAIVALPPSTYECRLGIQLQEAKESAEAVILEIMGQLGVVHYENGGTTVIAINGKILISRS